MNLELMEKKLPHRQRKTWQLHDENKDVREASASLSLMKFAAPCASKLYVFILIAFFVCFKINDRNLYRNGDYTIRIKRG